MSVRHWCPVCRRFATQGPKREAKPQIAAVSPSPVDSRTELEAAWDHWWHLLADPRLPRGEKWLFDPGRKFEADRAWPLDKLVVELEGKDHQMPDRYHRDIEKYNLMAEQGIRLFRYCTRTLDHDPEGCIRQVERALARGVE